MNIKKYKKIINLCDSILLSSKSSIYTHAITSLHILKEHPDWLGHLYEPKKKIGLLIKKAFKHLLILFFEKKNFFISNKKINKTDILILSNIINSNHLELKDDFYFGNLDKKLNNKGYKTQTILRNFTDLTSKEIYKRKKGNAVILTKCTDLISELTFFYITIREYFFLKKNFLSKIKQINKNLYSLLGMLSMISNLRIAYQIKEITKILMPEFVIIPFEGHAWERVLIKTLKDNDPNIKIAGYQFTVITKHQHSLFRPLKKNYNPDIIFTSGSITKEIFKKKYNCPIKVLGSKKSTQKKIILKQIQKKVNILILPEGFFGETIFLFNFSKACARKFPNFNFIFRQHPLLNLNLNIPSYLNNFHFSKSNLKQDFNRCSFVFYRGTAAVFESIFAGLTPIYIKKKNDLNINPLYEVCDESLILNSSDDLSKIIKINFSKKVNRKLLNYCNQYFKKLNSKSVESCMYKKS